MLFAAAEPIRANFVDIDVPLWAWAALGAALLVLLGIDLYRHRDDHEPSFREALVESTAWVITGISFGGIVALAFGAEAFGEYISGYLIEKSLSVDNVFVWSLLFSTLAIPVKYQHRVLFWGVFGALVLRGLFIAVGTALVTRFVFV